MTNSTGRRPSGSRRKAPATRLASESDRISTIHAGQGAKVTTRKNAAEAAGRARKNAEKRYLKRHPEERQAPGGPERSVKNVVLLVLGGIACLALVFLLGRCVASLVYPSDGGEAQRTEQNLLPTEDEQRAEDEQLAHDAGQEVAAADGTVSYGGETYSLQTQEDGLWGVVRTSQGGASETAFEIEGTPVTLARNADTLYVLENRDGGWDIVCYKIGGHAAPSYLMGSGEDIVRGDGDAASAELSGTTMLVTDASGATTEVSLV